MTGELRKTSGKLPDPVDRIQSTESNRLDPVDCIQSSESNRLGIGTRGNINSSFFFHEIFEYFANGGLTWREVADDPNVWDEHFETWQVQSVDASAGVKST